MRTLKIFKNLLITIMFVSLVCSACKKITGNDGPLPDDECDGYPYQPAVAQEGDEVRSCHLLARVFNFERGTYRAVREGRITISFQIQIKLVKKVGSFTAAEDLFKLIDASGNEYTWNNEYCGGFSPWVPQIGQVPLNQGEQIEGTVMFEIPKEVKIVRVELFQGLYIPNRDYKDYIIWEVK